MNSTKYIYTKNEGIDILRGSRLASLCSFHRRKSVGSTRSTLLGGSRRFAPLRAGL